MAPVAWRSTCHSTTYSRAVLRDLYGCVDDQPLASSASPLEALTRGHRLPFWPHWQPLQFSNAMILYALLLHAGCTLDTHSAVLRTVPRRLILWPSEFSPFTPAFHPLPHPARTPREGVAMVLVASTLHYLNGSLFQNSPSGSSLASDVPEEFDAS